METVAEPNLYLDAYAARQWDDEPARLPALRRRAIERFADLGFPTLRLEEWRHTNVAPIARTAFHEPEASGLDAAELASLLLGDCAVAVFENGRFAPEQSRLEGLPEGVRIGSLRQAMAAGDDVVEEHLGRYLRFEEHAFAALNTALFSDGAFFYVPRGVVVERPLQLLFVTTESERPPVVYPRTLLVAGESSQATVIECYGGGSAGGSFTCGATEIIGEENSTLHHYKLQRQDLEAFHVAVQHVVLQRAASLRSLALSRGAALARNDIVAVLDGEGVDCILDGLYLAAGKQLVDHHMRVEHRKPNCNSHELYKGILDGEARAVFNGRIYVHPQAQKTDAKQTNRNLLLSRGALVQSNPQLEIFADDVRCTHGSTTGQLDADALFYLRSRGLAAAAARGLLTYAFASELVDRIEVASLRQDFEAFLIRHLPGGEIVRQVS